MLDRFTDRARKVMSLAKEEARALKTSKVGTEHLLLALAKEQEGVAAEALRDLEITYDDILEQLNEIHKAAPSEPEPEDAKLAFTPLVISVMEKSFRLARENNQTYVSTEHLLLAIVSEGNGLAVDILRRLGVSGASVRGAVEKLTAKDQGKQRPWRAPAPVVRVRACRSSAAERRARPVASRRACSRSSAPTSRRRRARASSIRSSAERRRSPA